MRIQMTVDWKNRLSRGLVILWTGTKLTLERLWHTACPFFPVTRPFNRRYQHAMRRGAQQRLRRWMSLPNLPGLDGATKRRLLPVVRHYGNLFAAVDVWHEAAIMLAETSSLVVVFFGVSFFFSYFPGLRLSATNYIEQFLFPWEISFVDMSLLTGPWLLLWPVYVSLSWLIYSLVLFSVMFSGASLVFLPVYIVAKRVHYFTSPLFGFGWPTGVIAVYLMLISLLAPSAKIDPLAPHLTQIILVGVVAGLGCSVFLCSWFIAMLYGMQGIAITLLIPALERRRLRLYPEAIVTLQLLTILEKVTKYPTAWGTPGMKHELVGRLEVVASCLQYDLPWRLQSDIATDDWFQRMTEQMAAAMRALKPWVLMPKPDTREQFIARIADAFVHAAIGEWDALPRSEDKPQTQRERWRTQVTDVAGAVVIALLPLFGFWGIQQSPLAIPQPVAGYVTIGGLVWLVLTLLVSLDASFHAKLRVMEDVTQSVPFLGKWLGMGKKPS